MGYNKNFVVKNGLEVATNLIYADANNLSVGIGTTVPRYTLHTLGGIGATFATITGVGTIGNIVLSGGVSAGGSEGIIGQYLVRSGAGVTWQSLPSVRTTSTQTATASQTLFSFAYTVGLLDVYVNGVKLSTAEFVATDSASVTILQPCFGGETVEFITYSSVSSGTGYTGINGITVQNSGITTGTELRVTSINFTGAGVTAAGTGIGVTVTITNPWTIGAGTSIYRNSNSFVGIGSTQPAYTLDVSGNARVGINTSQGVILTSPDGTKYKLFVENGGTLKTIAV
jgi:hypothetical protein